MNLRLFIRQNPVYNLQNQQIYYDGTSPQNLTPIVGTLPTSRQWQNYGQFIDVTDYVSDLSRLQLTWTLDRDDAGRSGNNPQNRLKKSASGELVFELLAYNLIKSWLIKDVSASLNSVEVMIKDLSCGEFRGYIFESNDIQWCEDGLCQYSVILRQQDDAYACMKRTLVSDNWQGWFPDNGIPANGKKHPRFNYCNEIRPNSTLIIQWYTLTVMFNTSLIFIIPLLLAINPILWILQQIQNILNANWNIPGPLNLGDIFEGISAVYIESSGCGRSHPAPLIRDYITNVCDKCGITVNAQSAPLFFSPTFSNDSSSGNEQMDNPFYNACYFNAPVRRGLRNFRKFSLATGFQDPNPEYWINDNKPLLFLHMFLNQVLFAYNHDWRLKGTTLYIDRKDRLNTQEYIYDFREGSSDRLKIVEGICFEPTGEKFPAACNGIYIPDGADSCGNEAGNINGAGQMNGAVNFVATDLNSLKPVNPNFEGLLNKYSEFGATRFRFDGVSGDYIFDTMQVIVNGSVLSPLGQFATLKEVNSRLSEYADYALLLQSETALNPKLLIWDGVSYENAKCIKNKAAWDGVSNNPVPVPNLHYNPNGELWKVKHYPQTDVIGRGLTFPASPNGIYRVEDYFGFNLADRPALLVNYPMYFEPNYQETLWDRFHWIDDPERNPKMNYYWSVKLKLCCEDIEKIKALDEASEIVLNEICLLPFGYYERGTILEITISYIPDAETGRYIEIRGKL